jgi:hypothetical protein
MILSPSDLMDKALIGNDAGYLLSFFGELPDGQIADKPPFEVKPFEVGRDEYYGEIRATLPAGLEGGAYSFVIEGMTDEHYRKISQKQLPVIKLFLFWRDTNASFLGLMKNIASLTDTFGQVKADQKEIKESLVAVLSIVSVSRKAGSRRYETTIEARERVYDRLDRIPLFSEFSAADPIDAAKKLVEARKIEVRTYPITPGETQAQENEGTEAPQFEEGASLLETLSQLGRLMEQYGHPNRYGRGMYLIRNGALHIGERKFPVEGEPPGGGKIKPLTLAGGLIEVESLAPLVTDPNFVTKSSFFLEPPTRAQFKLTLKGRPDIKPGDVVKFDPPELELEKTLGSRFGSIGDLVGGPLLPDLGRVSDKAVNLYVNSVEHKLGRTTGFVTTVTGVVFQGENDVWDTHSEAHVTKPGEKGGPATAGGRAAQAVQKHVVA